MELGTAQNSYDALVRRSHGGTLTCCGPAAMLFARTGCGIGAQAIVAGVFALRYLYGSLPLPAALYGVLVFPLRLGD